MYRSEVAGDEARLVELLKPEETVKRAAFDHWLVPRGFALSSTGPAVLWWCLGPNANSLGQVTTLRLGQASSVGLQNPNGIV
jgi:hypothetical protein